MSIPGQSPINLRRVCRRVATRAGELRVIANFMSDDEGEEEWELSIVNEREAAQTWMEWFPSAEAAIEAGLEAIEEEGPEAFFRSRDALLAELMQEAAERRSLGR